ncbi:MAG: hypothetical protein QOJ12_695 [Thermoleophilales bacterium]|nr:hypothetical protein [Thermoleophilales bacterium]
MTAEGGPKVSDDLERWFNSDGDKTIGGFSESFAEKTFALLFVLLMATPALPLPTGGATHVFEIVVVVLALQLIAGRDQVWLPRRWRRVEVGGDRQQRLARGLVRTIRRVERLSRPRGRFIFGHRSSNIAFGVLVIGGAVGAFFAPPFSGLDTLPSLGVLLLSLGVLLEDLAVVVGAIVVGVVGVVLEVVVGTAAINGLSGLF